MSHRAIHCPFWINTMMMFALLILSQIGVEAGQAQPSCDGSVVTLWALPVNPPASFAIQWEDASDPGVFLVTSPSQTTSYRVTLTDLDTQTVYEDTTRILVHPGNSDLTQDGSHTHADQLLWAATWSSPDPDIDHDPDQDQRQTILDWFYFCDFELNPPNTPPSLSVGQTFTISGDTVLINVSLSDEEQVPSLHIASQPSAGFVTLISGELRYSSDLNFTGTDSFEIYASDGFVQTPNLTVQVQVLPPDTFADLYDDIFLPICHACHIDAVSGGLSLNTYAQAKIGGHSGAGFVAGFPDQSEIYRRVADQSMPLGMDPLTLEQVERIRLWILRGALP